MGHGGDTFFPPLAKFLRELINGKMSKLDACSQIRRLVVNRDKPFALQALDFFQGLRMTQSYQLDHYLSLKLFEPFFKNVLLEHG